MDTKEKLDKLAEMYAQQDVIRLDKQKLIDGILTPEIKEKMNEIEDEFKPQFDAVGENILKLESEIKTDVIPVKETVRGNIYMAVWSKGRLSWDGKALDGYIAAGHPELEKFRKEGDPSVSIRRI